jgi:hypothetical protein
VLIIARIAWPVIWAANGRPAGGIRAKSNLTVVIGVIGVVPLPNLVAVS